MVATRFQWIFKAIPLLLFAAASWSCQRARPEFDLIFVNGQVVDGSGAPAFAADVAAKGDTIVRVARLNEEEKKRAARVIDVGGLVVSPGFIDVHTHSDYPLLVDGTAQSKIRQGVTTEILGESESAGPIQGKLKPGNPYGLNVDWRSLGQYLDRLQKAGISVNVGSFVGATQVRNCIMGDISRPSTPEEMQQMKALVDEAMREGALGLSCALLVPPNTYLTTPELVELASAVKPYGGIFSIHIRTEGEGILDAVKEAIEVGEKTGVPVDILHLKIADRRLWGSMNEICDLVDEARGRGVQVTANQYPYIAGQNDLVALIPPWAMEGGREKMLERLRQPAARRRMERNLYNGIRGWFNHYLAMSGWEGCLVASVRNPANKDYEGKSIAEISKTSRKKPAQVVFDLLLEEQGSVPAVYFLMSEEDVQAAMKTPWVSIGSDGSAVRPEGPLASGKPHPRWYGTFPRVLGKYVREDHVLPLEEAVKKMTSLNAEKLGLADRGLLKEGLRADITVFDAQRVIDKATFENPHQYPIGIEYVAVNGVLVLEKEQHLGTKPGLILRRKR
jgi:N-acyl-D-amino-acid deacylase